MQMHQHLQAVCAEAGRRDQQDKYIVFGDSAVRLLLTMLPNRHSQYPFKVTNSCSVAGHILQQSAVKQGRKMANGGSLRMQLDAMTYSLI